MFAGVVVLYNPNYLNLKKNIKSYLKSLDKLYIVDNSEKRTLSEVTLLKQMSSKIEYIWLKKNRGIAFALNKGREKAILDGHLWLLTMDQDSYFKNDGLEDMKTFIKKNEEKIKEKYIIISPFHRISNKQKLNLGEKEVMTVMTSGNFLNLELSKKVGEFRNELFIDEVDHEYCYRAMEQNYKILVLNEIILQHKLGELKDYNLFYVTNHSPLRKYYKVRNKLYVANKYKWISKKYYYSILKEFIKIIMFEKDKLEKVKMTLAGIKDYKNNRFGKYEEKK